MLQMCQWANNNLFGVFEQGIKLEHRLFDCFDDEEQNYNNQ